MDRPATVRLLLLFSDILPWDEKVVLDEEYYLGQRPEVDKASSR